MLSAAELAAVLPTVKLRAMHGPWSRAIGYRHLVGPPSAGSGGLPQALWGGASKQVGARFTPKGSFDSIYLASDPVTAFVEISALIVLPSGPQPLLAAPSVIISIDGVISAVLDLTDCATLSLLGTNEQEISGSWAKLSSPPTQMLAQAVYDSGSIAGIHYPSVQHPKGTNLVVFPDRITLNLTDYLEAFDPDSHLTQRLGA